MAALNAQFPTLVDIIKGLNPDGSIARPVELLAKKNSLLEDIAFRAGNLPTGHKFPIRTALPTPTWRKLNQGVPASKDQKDTVEETCGMLESFSKVDVALAELNGNAPAYRADQDNAHFTGFGLEVARALFYEDSNINPERFTGLASRFTSTGTAAAQFITAGGAANKTSIWLVGWSPDTVFGIYPKNTMAGFKSEDLGKQLVFDTGGVNQYLAYVTHHKWQVGLCVQDYRYVSRLGNIDSTLIVPDASTGPNLPLLMQDMLAAMFETDTVSPVWYMNRKIFSAFNKQLTNKTANFLEYIERGGRLVPHYLGFPIRIADAITNTEA